MGNFKLMDKMIIHLICPDQMGIISRLTSILHESMNNILSIQQYVDKEKAKFYIRLSVQLNSEKIFPKTELLNLNNELKGKMNLFNPNKKINVAILGTKELAPIYDLLIKNFYMLGRAQSDVGVRPRADVAEAYCIHKPTGSV